MTTTTDGTNDERFARIVMRLADLPCLLQWQLAGEIRDVLAECEHVDCPDEAALWS